MMPESERNQGAQALINDILKSLKAILPGAIKEVLDEIISEYKQNLTIATPHPPPKQNIVGTYANITAGNTRQQSTFSEIQRFNESNRWYMDHMYHKRETAYFKTTNMM